jgi:MFS family permease
MGSFATYRKVFANRALARLMIGEFVSSIGDWLYLVALLVYVYRSGASPLVLGVVGAARIVPYILLSVPAGIAADRFDRRLILLVTDVARGVIMLVLAYLVWVEAPVVTVVAMSIIATCFSAFFSPAIGSLIPSLVADERELGPANATWASLDNLAFIIGPAVAALLLSFGSLPIAFLLNAVSFSVIAGVLWRLPVPPRTRPQKGSSEEAPSGEVKSAVRGVARPLSGLAIINLVDGFVSGGLAVLTVVIAVEVLGTGEASTGWLNAAIGLGGLLGAIVAGPLTVRRNLLLPMLAGGITLGVGLILIGQGVVLIFTMAAFVIATAGMLLLEIVVTTIFQRTVPDAIRGRTIGAMDTITVSTYALGAFLAPILADQFSPVAVLLVFGVAMAVATVLGSALVGQTAAPPPLIDGADRFMRLPLFNGLAPASLENAARHLVRIPIAAGEVVVRQGDPADRFYHILDGRLAVTQVDAAGELRRLRTLVPDDLFGEIGLLRKVPRTATVTAETDGELLALYGDRFLDLVNAGPGLTSRLLDMHRGAQSGN